MDVQVLCFRILELALHRSFEVSAFDDLPARHHSRCIKAAHGECEAAPASRPKRTQLTFGTWKLAFRRAGLLFLGRRVPDRFGFGRPSRPWLQITAT
jgi:hypothetical protein